jgi:hypothetical protein
MIGHNGGDDLGVKCFGITYVLSQEFSYQAKGGADILGLESPVVPGTDAAIVQAHANAEQDWQSVTKSAGGRVTRTDFKTYFMRKYQLPAPDLEPPAAAAWVTEAAQSNPTAASKIIAAFDLFLDLLFTSALRMMLPSIKDTIGVHCFKYAAAMAMEFYFPNGGADDVLEFKSKTGNPMAEQAWDAFQEIENNNRVNLGDFLVDIGSLGTGKWLEEQAYGAYVASIFDAGVKMMPLENKVDLGVHCFGITFTLSKEFYFNEAAGADKLKLVPDTIGEFALPALKKLHGIVQKDWETVEKDDDGRVTREAFRKYFMGKANAAGKFKEDTTGWEFERASS